MLKGERVALRAVERDDLQKLHELEAQNVDIEVIAGGVWFPKPLTAWEKDHERWTGSDNVMWFIIEVDSQVIGSADLHNISRHDSTAELGIGIYPPEYLGKGYGQEAIRLLCDYAFRIQNFHRLWLETFSTNERALKSYLACGFVEEGRLRQHAWVDGQYVDMVVMGLLRSEWQQRKVQS
ncbi:MAG: GNAT family protein [Anaerolineae bacterium]|nr:GNAT family N-acetyltransferase [Anaerolineae bacterium]